MTQTAVLIETLVELGGSGGRAATFSTQDHAAGRRRRSRGTPDPKGIPVYAWKGRRSRSTGGAPSRCSPWPARADGPNILDDGGDATLLVHKGAEYEAR